MSESQPKRAKLSESEASKKPPKKKKAQVKVKPPQLIKLEQEPLTSFGDVVYRVAGRHLPALASVLLYPGDILSATVRVVSEDVKCLILSKSGSSAPCGLIEPEPAAPLLVLLSQSHFIRLAFRVVSCPSQEIVVLKIEISAHPIIHWCIKLHLERSSLVFVQSSNSAPRVHAGLLDCRRDDHTNADPSTLEEIDETLDREFPEPMLAPAPICNLIRSELRPYQKHAVAWMLAQEEDATMSERLANALGWVKFADDKGTPFYQNVWTGQQCLRLPAKIRGAILADDMGLGKSVQLLTLCATTKQQSPGSVHTTLIVCPLTVLTNWEAEIKKHMSPEAGIKVCVFYGPERSELTSAQLSTYDFVLTTYNVLAQEYAKAIPCLEAAQAAFFAHEPEVRRELWKETSSSKTPMVPVSKLMPQKRKALADVTNTKKWTTNAAASSVVVDQDGDTEMSLLDAPKPPAAAAATVQKLATISHPARVRSWNSDSETDESDSQDDDDPDDETEYSHLYHDPVIPTVAMFATEFHRVILDEGHVISNRMTKQAQAAHAIQAKRRWLVSGTPIQNNAMNAFSIMQFLRMAPFNSLTVWNTVSKAPSEIRDSCLRSVVSAVTLRRTKEDRVDGVAILPLPPRMNNICYVELNSHERSQYDLLCLHSRARIKQLMDADALMKNSAVVLELILRMRQCCNDVQLLPPDRQILNQPKAAELLTKARQLLPAEEATGKHLALRNLFEQSESEVCALCTQGIETDQMVLTSCGHFYCMPCMNELFAQNKSPTCAACEQVILRSDTMDHARYASEDLNAEVEVATDPIHIGEAPSLSSKSQAVISALLEVVRKKEKVVIFSQWASYLYLLKKTIDHSLQKDVKAFVMDGRMKSQRRKELLRMFEEDADANCLLVSLKVGGFGITLTQANHVFLCDPWWNPSTADQAVDRVYRFGQTKPVSVVRFICRDTLEPRVEDLQDAKRALAKDMLADAANSSRITGKGSRSSNAGVNVHEIVKLLD